MGKIGVYKYGRSKTVFSKISLCGQSLSLLEFMVLFLPLITYVSEKGTLVLK